MQSEQLIRLVSRDELEALIQAFLDDCALANLSPKTLRFYGDNQRRFHCRCLEQQLPLYPTMYTAATVRDFLRYVQTAEVRWANHFLLCPRRLRI